MIGRTFYVYIMGNSRPTLYVGVTSNLTRRVYEHQNSLADGFTKKYALNKLFYFEETSDVHSALEREKQLKHWKRDWKLELIAKSNLDFKDLSHLIGLGSPIKPGMTTGRDDNGVGMTIGLDNDGKGIIVAKDAGLSNSSAGSA